MKRAYIIIISAIVTMNGMAQMQHYTVEKAAFSSSKYDEFSPVYFGDGVVFCSNKKNDLFVVYTDSDKKDLFSIYYSPAGQDISWTDAKILDKNLVTQFNDGPVTINEAGDFMFYSRNLNVDAKVRDVFDPKNRLGLFSARQVNSEWSQVEPFKYNNEGYSLTTPALIPSGDRLYFASDMPGGFGGTDLYYSDLIDGEWQEPVNMGNRINTVGNEVYPFITGSGEFYFASDGHKGLGNKDIFLTRAVGDEWLEPLHLEPPINSRADDFGLIADDEFRAGYFSSNRSRTDDIYYFETKYRQFYNCDSLKENLYCFLFYDENVFDNDSMPVKYEWSFSDGGKVSGLEAEYCFEGPGHYSVELNIVDYNTGNTFFTQSSYEFDIVDHEQPFITSKDAAIQSEAILFSGLASKMPALNIEEYHWEFGDGILAYGEEIEHGFDKRGTYTIQLGLFGKDEMGNIQMPCVIKPVRIFEDNQALAIYLATQEGALEPYIRPEADPTNDIRTEYTLAGHDPETDVFRVEVLKSEEKFSLQDTIFDELRGTYEIREYYLKDDSLYSYTVGEGDSPFEMYDVYKDVVNKGYNQAVVRSYVIAELPEEVLERINREFSEFADAYFEFDEYAVSEASFPVLDRVVAIMKQNPGIKMEIAAHTDNMGAFEYNMDLSQQRAQSIVDYMISRGISADRLLGKGYGESRPIASNATEEGRIKNRRVEFIILNQ